MTFNFRKTLPPLLLILAITFLAYTPALKNELLTNDDNLHVFENPAVRVLDKTHLKYMFTTTTGLPTYIPLTLLTFAVEHHFFGFNPFYYHLDNVLLHLAVIGLIYFFALQIGLSVTAAFAGCLLFAIHPMHVESVAWVTERKDLLYSFFYMLSLIFYWKYLSNKNYFSYFATIIFGILSVLAKPMALSLPLIMGLCDWYKGRKFDKTAFLDKIPHLLYIIGISMMTYLINARNPVHQPGEAVLFWIWCFVFYLRMFVWPTDLIIFNKFPKPFIIMNPEFLLSFIAFGLLVWGLWRYRKQKLFVFSMLFYFLSIFFLFRFDDIKYLPPVSSRFMYLPSLGFCFLIGYWIDRLFQKEFARKNENLFIIATCLIIFVFVILGRTVSQIQFWKNNIVHWSHELQYDPNNAMALVNRGEAYKDSGKYPLAFADFNRAVIADPEYPEGFNSRGLMLGLMGKLDQALSDFTKAAELKPNFDEAYNNIGIVYSMKNNADKAAEFFEKALSIDPMNAQAHYNLGEYYYSRDQFDFAFEQFQSLLSLDPRSAPGYNKRGLILGIKGQYDLALRDFNASIFLEPGNFEVYINRGIVWEHKRMPKAALRDYNTAIKLNPNAADAYYGRGNVYAQTGRYGDAAQDFKKALNINPKHVRAQMSEKALGQILLNKNLKVNKTSLKP